MATVSRLRRGFSFNGFPSFSYVLKDGLKSQTPQSKNSNFQALLEVSYCQEMSLFMDDLRSLNFPAFNASRSYLTSWRVVPQIDDQNIA